MMPPRVQAATIVAAVFALDRITKIWVESKISVYDTVVVIPETFNIVYTRNRGAAFGMLSTAPESVRLTVLIGLALVILGMIGWMLWQATKPGAVGPLLNRISLSLILGGAVGNLWDRVVQGSVTDFLQVFIGSYEWPSFNVADSAISIGAALMAIELIIQSRKQTESKHVSETH